MREILARAMSASDLSHYEFECAADRLGALAFGNRIGGAMLWSLLADQTDKLRDTAQWLAERIACRTNHLEDVFPIAIMVICERLFPHCRACNGAAHGKNRFGVIIECPTCGGGGNHRYDDDERRRLTGFPIWRPRHSRLIQIADAIISASELDALAEVRAQLERDLPFG
jgi:hypothetical protein